MIEDIAADGNDAAEVLITFFFNCVSNLTNSEPLGNSISDLVLKCSNFKNHFNILTLRKVCSNNSKLSFSFTKIKREKMLRKILKLGTSKRCQDTDFQTKTINKNVDIYYKHNIIVDERNFRDDYRQSSINNI